MHIKAIKKTVNRKICKYFQTSENLISTSIQTVDGLRFKMFSENVNGVCCILRLTFIMQWLAAPLSCLSNPEPFLLLDPRLIYLNSTERTNGTAKRIHAESNGWWTLHVIIFQSKDQVHLHHLNNRFFVGMSQSDHMIENHFSWCDRKSVRMTWSEINSDDMMLK